MNALEERNYARFVRQRRNLIAASLFLIFYKTAGLKISEINILGNQATISNYRIVFFSILIFFMYFCWRYFSSCAEVRGIDQCKMDYRNIKERFFRKQAYKILKNKVKNIQNIELKQHGRSLIFSIKRMNNISPEVRDAAEQIREIRLPAVRSNIEVLVRFVLSSTSFSEYIFPYLLSLIALIIVIIYNF